MDSGKKGFTLLEVLISISIFTVLLLAINQLFLSLYKQQGVDMAALERIQQAGRVTEVLSRELREANRGENGNFAISIAEDDRLVFFSDLDKDGLAEKIAYFLEGTEMKKTVTEPGDDRSYAGAETTLVVCREIQNGSVPIFTYYDRNYTGSESSMTAPVDVLRVRLVGISLTLNSLGRNSSYPLHTETKIELRNLK